MEVELPDNYLSADDISNLVINGVVTQYDPYPIKHCPTVLNYLTRHPYCIPQAGVLTTRDAELQALAQHTSQTYLVGFGEHQIIKMWGANTVDEGSRKWHNDSVTGHNMTFLYYVDTMYEEQGGSIAVRNNQIGGEEYPKTHYPAAGELFIVSQKQGFDHKAGLPKILRRVLCVDVHVDAWGT